jgi:hypothetical protein
MPDPIEEFFTEVGRRNHDQYRQVEGTVRLDLTWGHQQVDHWFFRISYGRIHVSRDDRDAECVIRADREWFERVVRGEADLRSAWLRHRLALVGSLYWLEMFQKLLPGPAGARDPRALTSSGRRS